MTFVGFGSFKRKQREARKGRNPKTGAELNIPAKKAVSFTAGKALKEAVSGIVTPPKIKAAPKAKSASAIPSQPKPAVVAPSKAKSATSTPASPKPVSVAPKAATPAPNVAPSAAKAPVRKAAPKKA